MGLGGSLDPDELTPWQWSALLDMHSTLNPDGATPARGGFSDRAFFKRLVKRGLCRPAKG